MTDTLWKPTDEPDIIAAEHIIASAHYKSKDWTDVYLVPVVQYHALAARVQAVERERDVMSNSREALVEVVRELRQQLAEAQGTITELKKPKLIISEAKVISYLANEVQNVLERIGYPHAFVTDMSTLGDFSDESQVAGKYLWQTAIDYLRAQSLQADLQVARLQEIITCLVKSADPNWYSVRNGYDWKDSVEQAETILRETGAYQEVKKTT